MKAKEIQELSIAEIKERLAAEQDNLLRLTLNHAISPIDNPMKIREMRRTIARFATILRQRETAQQ